jgi:hypothetical protein
MMTTTSNRWIAASGGVALLTFAVFVLLVSLAQVAAASAPLRGGAGTGYVVASTPLRGGAGTGYVAAATPLRGGAGAGYVASAPLRGGAGATYAAAGSAGRVVKVGRGGVFVRTTPVAASTDRIIGGIAVTALVIALIAFLALGSRASRRGELAPVTSLVQSPSASPAMEYDDRERKAA